MIGAACFAGWIEELHQCDRGIPRTDDGRMGPDKVSFLSWRRGCGFERCFLIAALLSIESTRCEGGGTQGRGTQYEAAAFHERALHANRRQMVIAAKVPSDR